MFVTVKYGGKYIELENVFQSHVCTLLLAIEACSLYALHENI